MSTIAVTLLGPFELRIDGRIVDVPPGPRRVLLASLSASAPSPVSHETLAAQLANGGRVDAPDAEVEAHLRALRTVLGDDRLRSDAAGWRLEIDPAQVDAIRFRRVVSTALRSPRRQAVELAEALELWGGDPFTGVESPILIRAHAPDLAEYRLRAVERLADLDRTAGRPEATLPRLRQLGSHYPLREPLWSRLIAALLESGRATDALACFHEIRKNLEETLDARPGPDLERLHQRIRGEALDLATAHPTPSTAPPPHRPRHHLPPRPTGFVGRDAELVALNELLGEPDLAPSGSQIVCTIHGASGVGKSALALEWAHRVADRFPDGQLYLNLRGDGLDPPTDAATAAASLLRVLGVPAAQIPTNPAAQSALLRDRLAGRRLLLLLDDARDADQVRPLLPGAHSMVLVTSRSPLPSLSARDGARQLVLDGLGVADTRKLLSRKLPPARLAAEPEALSRINDHCRGLPLALWVLAERAAARSEASLTQLADDLTAARATPDSWTGTDAATRDVHAVLSWAVHSLDPSTATAFRRLGLHPFGEITTESAAALLATSTGQARRELDRLAVANLLEPAGRGRYRLHDLLRRYAVELASRDNPVVAVEAVRRVVDWCLHSVSRAVDALGEDSGIVLDEPTAAVTPLTFHHTREVAAWFDAEHELLVAAVSAATEHELYQQGYELAYLLRTLFHWRLRTEDFVRAAELGVECARYVGDEALSRALRTLGLAYAWASRTEDATTSLLAAVSYAERTGDLARVAIAISVLGVDAGRGGDHDAALRYHRHAVDVSRRSDDPRLVGSTLLNLGLTQIEADDCDRGITTTQEALGLFVEAGAELEAAWALGNLAQAFRRTLRPDVAIELAERALPTLRRKNDDEALAEVLVTLGRAYQDSGRAKQARSAGLEAAELVGSDHLLTPQIQVLLGKVDNGERTVAG